jgi:hypothetical protein
MPTCPKCSYWGTPDEVQDHYDYMEASGLHDDVEDEGE